MQFKGQTRWTFRGRRGDLAPQAGFRGGRFDDPTHAPTPGSRSSATTQSTYYATHVLPKILVTPTRV